MAEDWTAEQVDIYNEFVSEGFSITVRVEGSPGVWNPETLKYTGATEATDYETYGLKKRYGINQIDGTIVQVNDTRLLIPAYGLPALTTSHKILIGSVEQNVINVLSVEPGNVALFYELQVRS
jgi:hypothetical protein